MRKTTEDLSNRRYKNDPAQYRMFAFSVTAVWQHNRRHALFRDFEDQQVITCRVLDQTAEGDWLISVEGRVYALSEKLMDEALDWAEQANLAKYREDEDESSSSDFPTAGDYNE